MRNYSLDFFRGIAAIFVCLGHLYFWNNNFTTISSAFILAVDFFLILSGFVISQSIFKKNKFSIPKFIINRWVRLFPVFILCLVIIAIPKIIFSSSYSSPQPLDIIKYLIIGHMLPFNLSSDFKDPLSIAYTISAEFWVGILLFPIMYFLKKKLSIIILGLLFIYSYTNILLHSPNFLDIHYHFFNSYFYFGVLRCIADYSLGIFAYLVYEKLIKITLNKKKISFIQIILITILLLIYYPINYNRNLEYIAPFIFFILIITLSIKDTFIYNLTNNKYGLFLGGVSYPIYLIHPFYIGAFSLFNVNINAINSTIYLTLCITSSWIIHYYYEKPMMNFIIK